MNVHPLSPGPATPQQQGALEIVHRLQTAGFIAYFAGGCVRDLVMRRAPKDYDIATNAVPDKVIELFPESVAVGKSFGVIRARAADDWYEIATFRKDAAYTDGRHPESVTFSDPETDAQRRDFTLNALFYDPVRQELLDYVQGLDAIEKRLIKAVGNAEARFQEDRLRLLRAVRFAATLDFALEPATAAAIRTAAPGVATLSAERIREELTRLLTEARRAGDALVLLRNLNLLEAILPEVAAMHGVEQPPEFHPEGDVFQHTVLMLNALHTTDPQLAWAVLLHDVGKPPTAQLKEGHWRFERHANIGALSAGRILERLRFSSEDRAAIEFMVGNHMRFADVKEMRLSTLRKLVGAPTFAKELVLHQLDCQASHRDMENYDYLVAFRDQVRSEPVLPAPWVNGRDIMQLGIPEGRDVGVWRQKAYEAQLEGTFPDREHLLAWLKSELAQGWNPEP
jgi:poly(A) polymerase